MNLEENSCSNHESLRQKNRNHEYQDSNDSASTPGKDQSIPEKLACNFSVTHFVVDLEHIT